MKPVETLPSRIIEKIKFTGECWLWTGCLTEKGYGKVSFDYRTWRAHRLAYEILMGSIPDGLMLDHLCRVRNCVNPHHMEVVTNRVNVLRGDTHPARNAAKTHCVHGHEFTTENTRRYRGARCCRTCARERTGVMVGAA